MVKNILYTLILVLLSCVNSFAATGDTLWSCNFETGASPSAAVTACGGGYDSSINTDAVIATGEGHDGNKAIRYYHPDAAPDEIVSLFNTPALNKQEVTLDFWEKYSVPENAVGVIWNCKSFRMMNGPDDAYDYMAGVISRHDAGYWYQSYWGNGTTPANLTINPATVMDDVSSDCTFVSTNHYTCAHKLQVGYQTQWGTNWRHIRVYVKIPTNDSSSDGATTVWINDELFYTLTNITRGDSWGSLPGGWYPYVSAITFHPSDDFYSTGVAFYHYWDDIVVYEGYVPPTGGDTTPPTTTISTSDPSNISSDTLAIAGTASDAVGVSGCKWRIGSAPDATHGTACTGTTSWTGTATGFSSGANTLHVACYDAAGNYGDDSIVVNYTPPNPAVGALVGVNLKGVVFH
jgi:hypothetical protein